jgi:hypothetical protein
MRPAATSGRPSWLRAARRGGVGGTPAKNPGSRRSEPSRPALAAFVLGEQVFERHRPAGIDVGPGRGDDPVEPSGGEIIRDAVIPRIVGRRVEKRHEFAVFLR